MTFLDAAALTAAIGYAAPRLTVLFGRPVRRVLGHIRRRLFPEPVRPPSGNQLLSQNQRLIQEVRDLRARLQEYEERPTTGGGVA